jgi:GNAT superfamily N-acetyltransferase
MKLLELFQKLPEDFAIRPLGIANSRPKNIPSFDPAYSKVVGTFDGKDVWGSREKRGYEIFGFKVNDNVVSYCIIGEEEVSPGVQEFRELWTDDNYRGRGLGSGLILFLTKKIKIKLLLNKNEIVSPDARMVLSALAKTGKIKITSDGVTADYESIFNDRTKNNIELMIESTPHPNKLFSGEMRFKDGRTAFVEHFSIGVMQPNCEYN